MKKKTVLFILPALLLLGCNGESASEATPPEALEATVMAKHDSAMARMDDIYKLRRNLRALRDTLAARQADTLALQALQQQITELNDADEVMMIWMRNYQAPDSLQPEQAMDYLQQELQKIERVQVIMDSTLTAAQQKLNSYEQQK